MTRTHDEPVTIAFENARVAGTFVTPGTLVPGVSFVHGWGGSQAPDPARARETAAPGCVCPTFDLRRHAGTREQFASVSRARKLCDVLATYVRHAERRHVDPKAIAEVGSGGGGDRAAILTTMRPVRWLALLAPAPDDAPPATPPTAP